MFGLFRRSGRAAPAINGRVYTHHDKSGSRPEPATLPIREGSGRRGTHRSAGCILVPGMAGSQMILVPRLEHGEDPNWPSSIPAKD